MRVLTVNGADYNSYRVAYPLKVNHSQECIGRVNLEYNLSHANTSKIVFFYRGKEVHKMYIKGQGRQNQGSLLFDSYTVDGGFENTNINFVGSEIIEK